MSIPIVFPALLILALALALAHFLFRRGKALPGFLAGIAVLGLYQLYLHVRLQLSVQSCLESACASSGLPAGCSIGEFGCTEWSTLAVLIFVATGIIQLILFLVIAGYLLWRQKRSVPRQAPDQEG